MYPEFEVPGVRPEDVWQLFNVSNYQYYKQKVADLIAGKCPFCEIDPAVNEVLFENESWRLWMNTMAPRSGQECQLIAPLKRHIEKVTDLGVHEWVQLDEVIRWCYHNLGLGADGVWLVRTGDPARNAKSVPHLHFNFQYPTGKDRVEVTIAKSQVDLEQKLPVLMVWEKMRLAEERGEEIPYPVLTAAEWDLVKSKMVPLSTK